MKKIRRVVASADTPPPKGFPRGAWWVLFLATFTFAVPLTSPWWSTVFRGEVSGGEEDGDAVESSLPRPEETPAGSVLKIKLHMRGPDGASLPIDREIPYVRGTVPQIRAALGALAVATLEAQPLLPEGTRVLDVAYAKNGTAYLDFSSELESGRGVGAEEEETLVKGIVRTVTDNFSSVRRVVILVDGKTPKPGHLDLSRTLQPSDPIFAVEEAEASPTPEVVATSERAPSVAQPTPIRP